MLHRDLRPRAHLDLIALLVLEEPVAVYDEVAKLRVPVAIGVDVGEAIEERELSVVAQSTPMSSCCV
jgi:hypothetical protein